MLLDQVSGPECPKCGSHDTDELRQKVLTDVSVYRCNHCRFKFSPALKSLPQNERPMVAIYQRTVCPFCETTDNRVTQGPRGPENTRYHHCVRCDVTFSSKDLS